MSSSNYKLSRITSGICFVILMLLTSVVSAGQYQMNGASGRYVRLELPGTSKSLRTAEVQVFSGGKLVSQSRPAFQSSSFNDFWKYYPGVSVDANTDPKTGARTKTEDNPWWYVDLGKTYAIDRIVIYRSGSLKGVTLKVSNSSNGSNPTFVQTNLVDDYFINFASDANAKKNLGDIWVIGDQVNLGNLDNDATKTPRSVFYQKLISTGYNFTFTGHSTANSEGLPNNAAYTSHSSVNGAKIADMTNKIGTYWNQGRLNTVKPETICIMLGTNDIHADLIDGAPERMKTLINKIYSLPGVGNPIIYVGAIPPNQTLERKKTNVNIYNEGLEQLVNTFKASGKKIFFVDHFNALGGETTATILKHMQADNSSEFGPGIHLNGSGDTVVGNNWQHDINKYLCTDGTDVEPWAFPKHLCTRNVVKDNPSYYEYQFVVDGIGNFSVIAPKPGVVHKSGKKPWMWRNIFYSSNTGKSINNDIPLIDEGFYAVNVYGSVVGHPDGNRKVKAVYDYLTTNFGFAPTFSASAMSRGGFMVIRFANEYPDLIEGILMDNACADGLSWPAGKTYAGHLEYAPGKYYSANGSLSSLELYLNFYTQYTTVEEIVEKVLHHDSPIDQLAPLAASGVKILSICGATDHAVPYEENDALLEAEYKRLGGDITVIVEDKGHKHGQDSTAAKNAFLNFVRDNVFRVPNNTPVTKYTVKFNLNGGTRTGGGALTQTVAKGSSATAPTVSAPSGYKFSRWSTSFSNVTSNLTVTAQYSKLDEPVVNYTVKFNLNGGTRTGGGALTQTVAKGSSATAPSVAAASGYTFTGWDKAFTNVSANITVTAQYQQDSSGGGDGGGGDNGGGDSGSGNTLSSGLGQIVRIELTEKTKLYLAEVQVFVGGNNIAPGKTATQSSNLTDSYGAGNAIDGDTTDAGFSESATGFEENPFWEVNLGSVVDIEKIVVHNVTGNNAARLDGFKISILNNKRQVVSSKADNAAAPVITFNIGDSDPEPTPTYTVKFNLNGGTRSGGGALTQTIEEGSSATAPKVAPPSGYTFTGWDKSFTSISSNLTVTAQHSPVSSGGTGLSGRFVRIELPGTNRVLSLAEVQVFSGGKNIALNKTASQSSVSHGGVASRAVDGNTNGSFGAGSVTHTLSESNPFWEVDLGSSVNIDDIVIFNRTDSEKTSVRLEGFTLKVLDGNRKAVLTKTDNEQSSKMSFNLGDSGGSGGSGEGPGSDSVIGQIVCIELPGDSRILSLAEVEVIVGGQNVAMGKAAQQSSVAYGGSPERAVDGNISGIYREGSVTHTATESNPYWEVNLGQMAEIEKIIVFNRTDSEKSSIRLEGFTVKVLDKDRNVVFIKEDNAQSESITFNLSGSSDEDFVNIALGKNTVQSSTAYGGDSSRAVDGNIDGIFRNGSVTHTQSENNPFWSVDLGGDNVIDFIVIHNRTGCCSERLSNFTVSVINSKGAVTFSKSFTTYPDPELLIDAKGVTGETVMIQLDSGTVLSLAEVEVYQAK